MSKIVKFDGNKIGINKEFSLIDSPANIKKISKHYKSLLEGINEDSDSLEDVTDNVLALAEAVCNGTADLLNLTKKEKDALENFSFDDQYNFFNECLKQFVGIVMPSHSEETEEKKEDPKSPEEEQSGN